MTNWIPPNTRVAVATGTGVDVIVGGLVGCKVGVGVAVGVGVCVVVGTAAVLVGALLVSTKSAAARVAAAPAYAVATTAV